MNGLKKYKAISGAVVIVDDSAETCKKHGFLPGEVIYGSKGSKILVGIGGCEGTGRKDIWFRQEGNKEVCCLPGLDIKRIKGLTR